MSSKPDAVITRLRASNFRSIESIDLELGALNVFVGQNGAGKSNIIDVLRFVRDAVNRGLDQALLDRGGIESILLYPGRGGDEIAIEVQCTIGRHEVVYGFSLTEDRKVREEHLRARKIESAEICAHLRLEDGQWVGDGDPSPLQGHQYPDSELHLSKTWWLRAPNISIETAHAVLTAFILLSTMSFYNISPESLRAPQQNLTESPFDEKGRNLAAVLRGLLRLDGPELNDIEGALARVVEGFLTFHISSVGSYLTTQLVYDFEGSSPRDGTLRRSRVISELAQESDGTLRILSILAALYQQPSRSLIVIEEPEINIHPGALGVIADLLREASLRSQILVTTHNPDLIEHFEPEALRVVEKNVGATQVGPVAHDQQEAIRQMLFSTAEIMKMEGLRREAAGV